MAGYALGFVMGATTGPRFALYRKWLRRCRMGPPMGSYGPRQPSHEVTYWDGYQPLPRDNNNTCPPPTDP